MRPYIYLGFLHFGGCGGYANNGYNTLIDIAGAALVFPFACFQHSFSVEKHSLSYSYFDKIAQSYCASVGTGWVFAIRRDCGGTDMCDAAKTDILKSISFQRKQVSCFNAFHITKRHSILRANHGRSQPDAGKVNIGTYSYGTDGCTWRANHCGPNYCCCRAY